MAWTAALLLSIGGAAALVHSFWTGDFRTLGVLVPMAIVLGAWFAAHTLYFGVRALFTPRALPADVDD